MKQNICFGKTSTFLFLLKTDVTHFIKLKTQLSLIKYNLPDTSKERDTIDKLPVFFFSFHGAEVLISIDLTARKCIFADE